MRKRKLIRNYKGIRNQKGQGLPGGGLLGSAINGLFNGFGGGGGAGGGGGVTGSSITGYLQNLQNQQTGNNQTTGTAANTYGAGQQGLQGQLGGLFGNFLQGNTPTSFTEPQAPMTAYNDMFSQSTEPGLVARYGAGSPQIGAQRAQGQEQLAGQLYQTGQANYLNALNSGTAYAMTPTGQDTTGSGATQANTNQNVAGTQANGIGSILSLLANLFKI